MDSKNQSIQKAISIFGGSQSNFAKSISVSRSQVWQWLNNINQVAMDKAIEIEDKTDGQVTCEELRPDVNWSVLRNKKATNAN